MADDSVVGEHPLAGSQLVKKRRPKDPDRIIW